MYAAAGGVLCFILACATLEYSWPNEQHRSLYYQVWGGVFPLLLVGFASAGKLRWPATGAALVFMGLWLAMGWGLRMVDAHPMLAPIYNPRTYMWPPYFPAWLIVPAFGIDLLLQRLRGRNPWLVALALGFAFVALQVAAQYPWSMFMLSPGARNPFFNGGEFPYTARTGTWSYEFWTNSRAFRAVNTPIPATVFAQGLLIAALLATLSSRLGLAWGGWMARVKR